MISHEIRIPINLTSILECHVEASAAEAAEGEAAVEAAEANEAAETFG